MDDDEDKETESGHEQQDTLQTQNEFSSNDACGQGGVSDVRQNDDTSNATKQAQAQQGLPGMEQQLQSEQEEIRVQQHTAQAEHLQQQQPLLPQQLVLHQHEQQHQELQEQVEVQAERHGQQERQTPLKSNGAADSVPLVAAAADPSDKAPAWAQQSGSDGLFSLEDTVVSPIPCCPNSFITSGTTVASGSREPRKALIMTIPSADPMEHDAIDLDDGFDDDDDDGSPASDFSPHSPAVSGAADLPSGTMAAMLAAEAARSATLERYGSLSLLSPSGGSLLSTLATPRLSGILPADLEPQAPLPSTSGANHSSSTKDSSLDDFFTMTPGPKSAGLKRTYSTMAGDRCTEMCEAAQAAAMGSPGRGGTPSLTALQQWQQTIEAAELHWGSSHPAVGRAWLELARSLQAVDKDSDRAKHATKKAFDICQILLKETGTESHAQESFQYLLARFNNKATAAKQAAAADAARSAAAAADALVASSVACSAAAAAAAPLPLSAPLPGHSATSAIAAAANMPLAAEQLQLPYLQPPFMLYPPVVSQAMHTGGFQALPQALQALSGLSVAAPSSAALASAAQLLSATLDPSVLMSCASLQAAALLPHAGVMGTSVASSAEGLALLQSPLLQALAAASATASAAVASTATGASFTAIGSGTASGAAAQSGAPAGNTPAGQGPAGIAEEAFKLGQPGQFSMCYPVVAAGSANAESRANALNALRAASTPAAAGTALTPEQQCGAVLKHRIVLQL